MSDSDERPAPLADRRSVPLEELTESRKEHNALAWFSELLEPDDVVWDVGAGGGPYTRLARDALGAEQVVSFEAEPDRPRICPTGDGRDAHRGEHDESRRSLTPEQVFESGRAPTPTVVRLDARGRERELLEAFHRAHGFEDLRRILLPVSDDAVRRWLVESDYAVEEAVGPMAKRSSEDWFSYLALTPRWADDASGADAEAGTGGPSSLHRRDRVDSALGYLRTAGSLLLDLATLVAHGAVLPKLVVLGILAMFVPFALVLNELFLLLGTTEPTAAILSAYGSILLWWGILGYWFVRC